MTFAIQTINNQIAFDFGFQLSQAVKHPLSYHEAVYSNTPVKSYIPIGSVEFVHETMKLNDLTIPAPINIPTQLNIESITHRKIFYTYDLSEIKVGNFVKTMTKVKYGYTGIIYGQFEKDNFPQDMYMVSEFMDFESEWRAFVLNGNVLDIRQYLGSYKITPDLKILDEIISEYPNPPVAYTIDIGVCNGVTSLIEIHNFYSCGLYGLSIGKAQKMWVAWWGNHVRNNIVEKNSLNMS